MIVQHAHHYRLNIVHCLKKHNTARQNFSLTITKEVAAETIDNCLYMCDSSRHILMIVATASLVDPVHDKLKGLTCPDVALQNPHQHGECGKLQSGCGKLFCET